MPNDSIVVILPALNEEKTVGDVIARIPPLIREIPTTVLVIDDGSSDKTSEIAAQAGAKVIRHPRQQGLGAAFRTGILDALSQQASVIVTIDSDGQFNPEDIPQLVEPLLEGQADMVTASRFIDPTLIPEMPAIKKWGNHRMSGLISLLTGHKFHDVSCGFRAYSRRAAASLILTGNFTYTQEVFLSLAFRNFAIKEVPIKVRGTREFGKSRVASSVISYGFRTLKIIFRCYRDYKPMRFFGGMATVLALIGITLWTFLGSHYLQTGKFSPHIWAGFTGASFVGLAVILFITGLLADMLDRIRMGVEDILYDMRTRPSDHKPHQTQTTGSAKGTASAAMPPSENE
jgi:glycosyltransferase involved in cell wall biosynthesis